MKIVRYKQNIGLLLGCSALLIVGTCYLIKNGGITYTSIVCSAPDVIPAVIVMYGLGWLIGAMIESSKIVVKEKDIGYTNTLLQEIIKEEGLDNISDIDLPDNSETSSEAEVENEESSNE